MLVWAELQQVRERQGGLIAGLQSPQDRLVGEEIICGFKQHDAAAASITPAESRQAADWLVCQILSFAGR